MGKITLVGGPMLVLVVSILLQGGNLQGATQPVCFAGSTTPCTVSGGVVTATCPINSATPCVVQATCTPILAPPAYCLFGQMYLNPGQSEVSNAAQVQGQGVFNFGTIGLDGFITMITIGVSIATLTGITIFGNGLNQESIHVIFMASLVIGIWTFLSLLDGFGSGNANSFFVQVNQAVGSSGPPLGTVAYVIATLFEIMGFLALISRGH